MAIVSELRTSLDMQQGSEIAENNDALYEFRLRGLDASPADIEQRRQ